MLSMEGRWGRRVFGAVENHGKWTLFRLEYTLRNGCVVREVFRVTNEDLEDAKFDMYGYILDRLTERLNDRVEARIG